jgi:hypothetical protein
MQSFVCRRFKFRLLRGRCCRFLNFLEVYVQGQALHGIILLLSKIRQMCSKIRSYLKLLHAVFSCLRKLSFHVTALSKASSYRGWGKCVMVFRTTVNYCKLNNHCCGLGSSVGIATDCGLGGSGIESRWGRDFPRLSRPALGPTQPPVQWVPGLSRG